MLKCEMVCVQQGEVTLNGARPCFCDPRGFLAASSSAEQLWDRCWGGSGASLNLRTSWTKICQGELKHDKAFLWSENKVNLYFSACGL